MFLAVSALHRRFENNHFRFYSFFSFCLIKKKQKIKKVRRLHRGKASLQRGLSFFFDAAFCCYERGVSAGDWLTRSFSK